MGKRRPRGDNGFEEWGGYMDAKKAKLLDQYKSDAAKIEKKTSNIFKGVAIMVNGWTKPTADELKELMAEHGGVFHLYQMNGFTGSTTHIIASNLPNVKIKNLGNIPIVKPEWITDSIKAGRRLNYKKYILYTNQSRTQPKLDFLIKQNTKQVDDGIVGKERPSTSTAEDNPVEIEKGKESNFKRAKSQPCLDVTTKSKTKLIQRQKSDNQIKPDTECDDLFMKANFSDILNDLKDDEAGFKPSPANDSNDIFSDSSFGAKEIGCQDQIEDILKAVGNKNLELPENRKPVDEAVAGTSKDIFKDSHNGLKKDLPKTASDPKFLSEFYNNSRLHLISTLGAEFKQLVCNLREKSNGIFPGKDRLMKSGIDSSQNEGIGTIQGTVIMHIDMDCFFVSVGLRNHPELRGKPVAVAHARGNPTKQNPDRQTEFALYAQRFAEGVQSRIGALDSNSSMSEIASCSYESRKCGIKNGMFLGTALKLCPELKTIPYDFEGYKEVSKTLYGTVASYSLDIEAVSCDEMYVDVTGILEDTGMTVHEFANHIRSEIMEKTGCPCSAGFGNNRLQARLATRRAKPCGQFYLRPEEVEGYMFDVPLKDLPGVGYATLHKLEKIGLKTCGDVQGTSLSSLQSELGSKLGEILYDQSRGIDKKPLNFEHERKSVSAEVNYGIRFKTKDEALKFFESLSEEVCSRLKELNLRARSVTLKVMVRAAEAPTETAKFLGHGICDSLSRCTTTNYQIHDAKTVFKEVKNLYERLNIPPNDLRGIGIQLGRLEKPKAESSVLSNFLKKGPQEILNNNNQNEKIKVTENENKDKEILNKSKRGRPKGSKTSLVSRPKKSNLTNFFKSGKIDSIRGNSQSHQNHSIDLEVLNELPKELREEIMSDLNAQSRLLNSFKTRSNETLTNTSKSTPQETNKNELGFNNLSKDELKDLIRNWLKTERPLDCDTAMLGEHFRKLALDRKIEHLEVMVKFLHRLISKLANCLWHKAYAKIVDQTQAGMVSKYGNGLYLPRNFNCDCDLL